MKSAAVSLTTALLVMLGLASSASAQSQPMICNLNATGTPTIRGEGTSELLGDLVIVCAGGTLNTATASQLPTVTLTVTLPQPVTSRLVDPSGISEALLLIDDPGTAVGPVPGFGNAAPPLICPFSQNGCPAYPNLAGNIAVMTAAPSPLGSPAASAPNLYQGFVNNATPNTITFFGVPVLPPDSTSTRTFRITNVRMNATSLAAATPVVAAVSIANTNAGAPLFSLGSGTATVATVQSSLSVFSASLSRNSCNALNYVYVGNVSFQERFQTAFRPRVTPTAAANSGQSNALVQTTPGVYFSESGYEIGLPQNSVTAGLADYGTRLKAIFTGIPAGVRLFVSYSNMTGSSLLGPGVPSALFNSLTPGNSSKTSLAELVSAEGAPDTTVFPGATATISSANTGPAPAGTPYLELNVNGGAATAVWEVLNTDPTSVETFTFDVWLMVPQGASGNAFVNPSYAPTAAAAAGPPSVLPAFVDPNANAPRNAFSVNSGACAQTGSTVSTVNTGSLLQPLSNPQGVAVDSAGDIFVADTNNNRIVMIAPNGSASVVAGTSGFAPGPTYAGDNGPAVSARLFRPTGVAVDSTGTVYVADNGNNVVRSFVVGGNITTVAGNGTYGFNQDNILATKSALAAPLAVAVDSAANVYIADTNNNRIRMVSATTHLITTVAGTGSAGYSGDNGPATAATLSLPNGIAVDSTGNIYFSDNNQSLVRRFTVNGVILTVAGGTCCGFLADNGPATAGSFAGASGLAVDASQNLYIAETFNNRVRMVSGGTITTVAGTNAPAGAASPLAGPLGVAVDSHGALYVADTGNSRIERVALFQGTVSLGSVSGPPGGVAQVPVTVSLNPGVTMNTFGLTIQVSSGSGTLQFTPAAGISSNYFSSTEVPGTIVLAWGGLLASGANASGSFPLGTVSVPVPLLPPPNGQFFTVQISQVGGDLQAANGTITSVPLLASPPANINVVTCNGYLVGDGYPVTNPKVNNTCGQFGDNQLTFEDLIVTVRAFGNVPGWAPGTDFPVCSDFFDALKAGPPDNPATPVKGQINITDLEITVNRWANLDPARPTRASGSYLQRESLLCAVPHDVLRSASLAGRPRRPTGEPAAGAVELGAAEVSGTTMRVPVYLRASQTLTGLGFSVGWGEPSAGPALRFVNGTLPAPGVLDTEVRGMLTAAWLQNIPAASSEPFLLGYVEWDRTRGAPSSPLQFYHAEGRGEDQMPLRLESPGGSMQ